MRSFRRLLFLSLTFGLFSMGCGRNERMDALYAQRCVSCHGWSGRGDGAIAASLPVSLPDFRQTVERKSTGQIRRIISSGRGMMPAFSPALRPAQISDMVSMVRFLSREGRAVSWWEKYDTLVVAHCSVPWDAVFGSDDTETEKR
jgi:Cytochrome C oxidase, cbb3-type, subunit III